MNNNKQFIKKPEVLLAFRFGYDDVNSYAFIEDNIISIHPVKDGTDVYEITHGKYDNIITCSHVSIGDWFVQDDNFGFKIYSDYEFRQKFDQI